jgi:isopentenyl phosphate kinase
MHRDVLLVKFGGAAITFKGSRRTPRLDSLQLLAGHLSRLSSSSSPLLVLVHGAGSFGHHEAAAHRLASRDPADAARQTAIGLASCRASLAALNSLVLDALVGGGGGDNTSSSSPSSPGLPAVTVPVFPAAHAPGALGSYGSSGGYVGGVVTALSRGLVPVLHGDVVLVRPPGGKGRDDEDEMAEPTSACHTRVVSGDEIISVLASALDGLDVEMQPMGEGGGEGGGVVRLSVRRAVFVTGADGVFTAPPDRPELNPRLVERVVVGGASGEEDSVTSGSGSGSGSAIPDVTGGIVAKLRVARGMVQAREAARRDDTARAPLAVSIVGVAAFVGAGIDGLLEGTVRGTHIVSSSSSSSSSCS